MKIGNLIYLDHQATTPVDRSVLATMAPFHRDSFGNPHSSDHSFGWDADRTVEDSILELSRLIGADTDEIFFTSGATESNNLALLGLGRRSVGTKRRRLLVSAIEHKCVLAVARVLQEQYGYIVDQIPVNRDGSVDLTALGSLLDDDVLSVSVMAVNNEIGTIQDLKSISELVRKSGAIFHCDAAQAPLAISLEHVAAYTDLMSLSSHKMYGPKGIGIAFISRWLQDRIEPILYGGGQQNGLRSGTIPTPLCVGMGAAASLLCNEGGRKKRFELRRRRDWFVSRLENSRWSISLNGPDSESRHPGNANICFSGFSAHDILIALQPRLAASTGSACASGIEEPSHVLRAIGLSVEDANSSIRFSLGFDTADEDIEDALELIDDTLSKLTKINISRST